jgi:hypothetical protein
VSKREKRKGLSGGKRFGPPPKRGPQPRGLKLNPGTLISLETKSIRKKITLHILQVLLKVRVVSLIQKIKQEDCIQPFKLR